MINIVYLILIYVIICFSMIIFNILAIIYGKGNDKLNSIKSRNYKDRIKKQFNRLEEGLKVEEEHLKYLKKRLKYDNELVIIDSIINRYKRKENKFIDIYLDNCKEVFIDLLYYYRKKNSAEKAYYLSVIRDYNLLYKNKSPLVEEILFDALNEKSFYCRDNAYLAICKMGDENKLYKALLSISESNKYFHRNLIVNGLNTYNGDMKKLSKLLVDNFDKLRNDLKCSVIEYLFYYDSGYSDFVFSLLSGKKIDRDLRLSCIKYFEYVYYKDAEKLLITYVLENFSSDITLCLASVKALRNYTSESSIYTIKKAIYSKNLKIVDMACESLAVIKLGLNPSEIEEIEIDGEVSDMYNYHIRKSAEKMVK